jgi:ribonucleoside-diphosphate reductase subunit M2
MESPIKKLDFTGANKENAPFDADLATLEAEMDAAQQQKSGLPKKEEPKASVAPTIKPEEADEPLLQENPQRFVLFPIKYHEVRHASRRASTRKVENVETPS